MAKSREYILGEKVGLDRISGLIGKARLMTIFIYLRARENPIIPRKKDGSQIPRRKKTGSENQGVTNLPPLRKSRPRDFRAYLPGKGHLPVCDLDPSVILSSFVH
jgi:hypothetical protein